MTKRIYAIAIALVMLMTAVMASPAAAFYCKPRTNATLQNGNVYVDHTKGSNPGVRYIEFTAWFETDTDFHINNSGTQSQYYIQIDEEGSGPGVVRAGWVGTQSGTPDGIPQSFLWSAYFVVVGGNGTIKYNFVDPNRKAIGYEVTPHRLKVRLNDPNILGTQEAEMWLWTDFGYYYQQVFLNPSETFVGGETKMRMLTGNNRSQWFGSSNDRSSFYSAEYTSNYGTAAWGSSTFTAVDPFYSGAQSIIRYTDDAQGFSAYDSYCIG